LCNSIFISGAYSAPPDPLAGFKEQRRKREGKGREREERGGRDGLGEGRVG